MSVISITDVSSKKVSEERLWGCYIDFPVPGHQGETQDTDQIDILGWVLGRKLPVIAVEILSEGSVLCRAPVDIRRSDIGAAFPEVAGAERSGFQATLSLPETAPGFELLVRAIFEDDSHVQIGTIQGRHSLPRRAVEIKEVSSISTDLSVQLWGCHVDLPVSDSQTEVYAITVAGWVLGRSSPAIAVELVNEEAVFRRIPVNVQRPDIAEQYPAIPEAKYSGFRVTVSAVGLAPEFELFVRVVLEDESRIPIGAIRARRHSLTSSSQTGLQPIMLTALGRTGSTWVMRLLGQHPLIVTYRPFQYEPKVGSYWMQILKTLSEPASYLKSLAADLSGSYWWLENEPPLVSTIPDPQIKQWLERDHIEELVTFCQSRIDEFYKQVALSQDQIKATYFAEKYSFDYFPREMIQELYPQAREIILVRDFRDIFCSTLAYNAKQGYTGFGRGRVNSDEEYIKEFRLQVLYVLQSWRSRSARAHLLRYEDLILRPAETLNALLEYLELDPTPSTVEGMIQSASEEVRGMQEHQTSPSPERSIGRWRRDLSPSLQDACQEAFGDVLQAFGYTEN